MQTPAAKWQDPVLAEMRRIGDPLADRTVDRVFETGNIERVNELLMALVRNDQVPPAGLDQAVYEYLRATEDTPVTDPELVLEAQTFFKAHGDLVLFSLVCASLPECYTMKRGINVLWLTQRLNEHTLRRLLETAQLVLKVLSPGGLERNGAGVCAAAKVRLMHAAIRRLLLHGRPTRNPSQPSNFSEVLIGEQWDAERLGYPINQTDLAYTLLTFAHVIPRSMERLGVEMTRQQKDAFLHCWNVIGLVMGIRPEMLAADCDEAEWLFSHIKQREGGESDEGKAMTASLMHCLESAIPGHLADFVPVLLMRELMDRETCSWLGIREAGIVSAAAQTALVAEIRGAALMKREAHERLLLTPRVWDWAAGKIITFLTNYEQPPGWNRELFSIPDRLAAAWSLPPVDGA